MRVRKFGGCGATAGLLWVVACGGLAGNSAAWAASVSWTITGGTFTDGGTLTGTFVYDAVAQSFGTYTLSVAGGSTAQFPAFTYTNANSAAIPFGSAAGHNVYQISVTGDPNHRQLILGFNPNLTNDGGSVSLFVSAGNATELNNSFANARDVSGGTALGTVVPQPPPVPVMSTSALAGFALLLAALGAWRLSRKPLYRS